MEVKGGVIICPDKSDREILDEIHCEIKALKEDMKRLSTRIGFLELLLIPEDEEEGDEDAADIADERDRLIAWARLKEELGL